MRISFFLFSLLTLVSLLSAKVDLNHASKKELMNLNGVGAKKADRIIDYRTQKCFETVDELAKVKGIGESIVAKNRSDLELTSCTE